MSQFDDSQLYVCKMLNYATKQGDIFTIFYPRSWIDQDLKNNCKKCKTFGSWQGYRIARCTEHCENGCGMIDIGVEYNVNSPNSATNTYLKGVNWEKELGDHDFGETHKQLQSAHPQSERRSYKGEWYIIDRSQCPYTMTKESEYTSYKNPTIHSEKRKDILTEKLGDPLTSLQRLIMYFEKQVEDDKTTDIPEEDLQALEEADIQMREKYWTEMKVQEYEKEQEEIQEEIEETIKIFKMEEGIETKWFEMKINEYDEAHAYDLDPAYDEAHDIEE